jgi:F0F1-type ATP synthase assembly protein I
VREPGAERPWLAVAAEWTSRVTTVAGQMVLPPLVGLWLDRLAGTVCLFLILGALLGFAAGMIQLVHWMRTSLQDRQPKGSNHPHQPLPPCSPSPPPCL